MYSDANDYQRDSFWDIHEWNLDKTVKPHVMVRGVMGKTSASEWVYLGAENNRMLVSGTFTAATAPLSADSSKISAVQEDAGKLRVSAVGVTVTTSPLSADSSSISAKQENATNLRVSAFSNDAALFHVSAIGGTAGDNTLVDGTSPSLSATILSASTVRPHASARPLVIAGLSEDASLFRVSALGVTATSSPLSADSSNVSAKQEDGTKLRVCAVQTTATLLNVTPVQPDAAGARISARSDDGGLFRVSAINTLSANQQISAYNIESTGHIGSVSSVLVDDNSITKFLGRVSALGVTVTPTPLSADSSSISAKQESADKLRISAFTDSAGQFRISSILVDDTTINKFFGRVSSLGGLSANQQISAYGIESTGHIGSVSAVLVDDASITKFLGRVSALGVTATSSPLSADSSSVSAKQGDAGLLHVSAFVDSGSVSAVQGDASKLRISAALFDPEYSNAGANIVVSATTVPVTSAMKALVVTNLSLSAGTNRVSAFQTLAANLLVSASQGSAEQLRVSAIQDGAAALNVSAKSIAAATMLVSAHQGDGAFLRTSAVQDSATNLNVSAKSLAAATMLVSASQGDASMLRISAYADDAAKFRVSALGTITVSSHEVKQSDASSLMVSGKSDSAGQLRISAFSDSGTTMNVSAKSTAAATMLVSAHQGDGAFLRTSAVQDGAAALNVSAKSIAASTLLVSASQGSADQLRVSALQYRNTSVGTGRQAVAVVGTEQQLSSVAVKRVIIQAVSSNVSAVAIGDVNIDAANHKGVLLFPTQTFEPNINNLNLLYVDSQFAGDGISIYYEV